MLAAPLLLLLVAQPPASPIDTRSAVLGRIHALCPGVASMNRRELLAEERRVTQAGGGGNRMYPGQAFVGAGWLQAACLRAMLSFLDPPPKAN